MDPPRGRRSDLPLRVRVVGSEDSATEEAKGGRGELRMSSRSHVTHVSSGTSFPEHKVRLMAVPRGVKENLGDRKISVKVSVESSWILGACSPR